MATTPPHECTVTPNALYQRVKHLSTAYGCTDCNATGPNTLSASQAKRPATQASQLPVQCPADGCGRWLSQRQAAEQHMTIRHGDIYAHVLIARDVLTGRPTLKDPPGTVSTHPQYCQASPATCLMWTAEVGPMRLHLDRAHQIKKEKIVPPPAAAATTLGYQVAKTVHYRPAAVKAGELVVVDRQGNALNTEGHGDGYWCPPTSYPVMDEAESKMEEEEDDW